MNEEKMPSNSDEFLEDLDRLAIRARENCKKYGLDDKEIAFIESMIRPME